VIVEIKTEYATPVTRDREMKMKGGISVLVGALLVVFSLTMVAEAQRKNRIRGNQGRKVWESQATQSNENAKDNPACAVSSTTPQTLQSKRNPPI